MQVIKTLARRRKAGLEQEAPPAALLPRADRMESTGVVQLNLDDLLVESDDYEEGFVGKVIAAAAEIDDSRLRIDARSLHHIRHEFQRPVRRPRGLGDTVELIIRVLTLGLASPCAPCRRRKRALNRLLPYRNA